MEHSCQVFPPCDRDPLQGLDGQDRMTALAAMLQSVKAYLVSELSAVPARIPRIPPPNAAHFEVEPATAEVLTGLSGVRNVTAGYAANGKAITLPWAVMGNDPMFPSYVNPLFVVEFEGSGPWNADAQDRPFFKHLASLLKTEYLVFGYSADIDPDG